MDFPDRCTIESKISSDGYHDHTYGTSVSVKCNYREIQETDMSGSNITSYAKLFLPPGAVIAMDSRVTLADGAQPYISEIRNVKSQVSNRVAFIRVVIGAPGSTGGI